MAARRPRAQRDALALRMHLAGVSYRDVAAKLGMSAANVHKVVRRELDLSAERRESLGSHEVTVTLERLEQLLAAQTPLALKGDPRAAEQCRRLTESIARLQGLFPSVAERLPAPRTRLLNDSDDDDSDEGSMVIDLEEMRWKRTESGSMT